MPFSRTHRPKRFSDVTGQSHITETLRNEISSGMLGHAYLFSGPRGVGKTTTARIFAKALLNEKNEQGEPPDDSEVSKEIDAASCIDFVEIDAASHTGVENIRESIIEHSRFSPARWKRKVYIIDECHMLSASAWNAMLKTLEEPPSYAFFILATTELHKVPDTIKSRCQRFEFKRIEPKALADRIQEIAKLESFKIEDEATNRIVRASDGCVRDAESLLEQIVSFADGGKITNELVSLVLPHSDIPQAASLFSDAMHRDLAVSLRRANEYIEEGMQPAALIDGMLEVVRALIRAEDPSEKSLLECGDEGQKACAALIGLCSLQELGMIALMLIERRRDAKSGTDPMFCLELALLAIAGGLLTQEVRSEMRDARVVEEVLVRKASSYVQDTGGGSSQQPGASSQEPVPSKKEPQKQTTEQPLELITVQQEGVANEATQAIESQTNELPRASDAGAFDIHDIRKYWNVIIKEVEKSNPSLPFILKICRPDRLEGNTLHIHFEYSFHREKLIEEIKTKRTVEQALRTVMKSDHLLIDGFCAPRSESGDEVTPIDRIPQDVVSRVLNAFGGQVVE